MQQNPQPQQQGSVNQSGDITQDLDSLFDQLRIEKQGQGNVQTIEKSSLLALMLYLNLDQTDPQFFSYLQRSMNEDQDTTLTKERFQQLFLDPKINMHDLKSEELAQVFSVFDGAKKGSFSADDFLKLYRDTSEYAALNQQQAQAIELRIKKDFEIISPEHKEITPIEFFKIINSANQN